MSELVYHTRRNDEFGTVRVWVFKENCTKCGKVKMGKPVNPKTGKVKIRAKEYVCPECGFTEEKVEHEESLTLEAQYTCPHCGKEGESTGIFKRKKYQKILSLLVECQHCGETIPLTKKLKGI